MKEFSTRKEIRKYLALERSSDRSIGLVPTMGALHKGHMTLIKESLGENDLTVATIFVNPAQFNNASDLSKYPRTMESDKKKLEEAGVDVVFTPPTEEIYSEKESVSLSISDLGEKMEGKFRPGHFEGVARVVCKLFNIVQPDRAYFGQKDLQQFHIIQKMNEDLRFDIELKRVEIARDANGLALSSRNQLLSDRERENASILYSTLLDAGELLMEGMSIIDVQSKVKEQFSTIDTIELEYFEIVNAEDLSSAEDSDTHLALCIAGYVNGVRLIDNTLLTLRRI